MVPADGDWAIERLSRAHDRSGFDSGNAPLDVFLRTLVRQYEKRNLGRTFVLVRPGSPRVLGYHTLASGSISFENLPRTAARKLPGHPAPVVLLARLAVDRSVRGQGLGERLLLDALDRALTLSRSLGVHAVEVHAIDGNARRFYRMYGFVPLRDRDAHLDMPIATIAEALDASP